MPSPFPGMDPYLEQEVIWHDFHRRFLPAAAAYLTAQALPSYIVLIDVNAYFYDLERESFLGVRDRVSRSLVTVVELLSPANKRDSENRPKYLAKRSRLMDSSVHLVEIDLLRGGSPPPPTDRPDCDYSALVSRAEERPRAGFWPIGLRDPLPTVLVPLRVGDGDARLDLRAILDRVYDEAGYLFYVYRREPDPPLTGAAAAWARSLIPPKPERP